MADALAVASGPRRAARRCCRGLGALLCLALLGGVFGCTSTITQPRSVCDPVQAFVLSEAMHTGLVLPPAPRASGEAGQYVEFGFGDWSWYALGNDAWYDAFATVLWPTQGTLGRRVFRARTPAELRRAASWAELVPITIARADAARLRQELQREFDAARKQVVVRPELRFRFVPSERSYWLCQNCVDRVAVWLEQLGCAVSWRPVRLGLAVSVPQ